MFYETTIDISFSLFRLTFFCKFANSYTVYIAMLASLLFDMTRSTYENEFHNSKSSWVLFLSMSNRD